MKLAIMGLGESAAEAPIDDPDYIVWGLPWDGQANAYDRVFEMHDRSLWERRGPQYLKRLQEFDIHIFMQEQHRDIEMSRPYPLDRVTGWVERDYFGSSISYMLALAIMNSFSEIGLYGVDLHGEDGYEHQRPNIEYLLGMAAALGITVTIPDASALLKTRSEQVFLDEPVFYPQRYGYL